MDNASGVVSRKTLLYLRSTRFLPMLPSRRFSVSHFSFRSMIHFDLLFVTGIRSVPRIMFLHVVLQLFHHHLLKIPCFLHYIAFVSFLKNQLTILMWVCFWTFCFVPLVYLSILLPIAHYWLL